MNTLLDIATQLSDYKKHAGISDVRLARECGVSRQSISRTLSGHENFTATTFLAMADALGLAVILVPKEAAQALQYRPAVVPVRSLVDGIRNL